MAAGAVKERQNKIDKEGWGGSTEIANAYLSPTGLVHSRSAAWPYSVSGNRSTQQPPHLSSTLMGNRREFLGITAGAGATLTLTPQLLRALQQQSGKLIQRAIPSTGEMLPVIGLTLSN